MRSCVPETQVICLIVSTFVSELLLNLVSAGSRLAITIAFRAVSCDHQMICSKLSPCGHLSKKDTYLFSSLPFFSHFTVFKTDTLSGGQLGLVATASIN